MNLESWLCRRDEEERILSSLYNSAYNLDFILHLSKQEEAEQEIERILRA